MSLSLYELAMQIVPVMLIALFLDTGDEASPHAGCRGWWRRAESRLTLASSAAAFFVSMFVVADVAQPGRFTHAVVIAALSATLMLLYSRSARRARRRWSTPAAAPAAPGPAAAGTPR